jgi:hypothetical protein
MAYSEIKDKISGINIFKTLTHVFYSKIKSQSSTETTVVDIYNFTVTKMFLFPCNLIFYNIPSSWSMNYSEIYSNCCVLTIGNNLHCCRRRKRIHPLSRPLVNPDGHQVA